MFFRQLEKKNEKETKHPNKSGPVPWFSETSPEIEGIIQYFQQLQLKIMKSEGNPFDHELHVTEESICSMTIT